MLELVTVSEVAPSAQGSQQQQQQVLDSQLQVWNRINVTLLRSTATLLQIYGLMLKLWHSNLDQSIKLQTYTDFWSSSSLQIAASWAILFGASVFDESPEDKREKG